MRYKIEFSEEKNAFLRQTRGISFDEIAELIQKNKVIANKKHHNVKKYPKQKILLVKVNNHIYAVPYVVNETKKSWFLKTIYPSRKLTKLYAKK